MSLICEEMAEQASMIVLIHHHLIVVVPIFQLDIFEQMIVLHSLRVLFDQRTESSFIRRITVPFASEWFRCLKTNNRASLSASGVLEHFSHMLPLRNMPLIRVRYDKVQVVVKQQKTAEVLSAWREMWIVQR